MIKPQASATIPGVTDTLDFVKNLWGSMNIPGAGMGGMPGMGGAGLSTEDLDKRIADMKAVESWLNLNLTMLRGTIQTMEVQRNTLATLKSMGASMAEAMRQSGVSADKMANTPFASFFGQPAQGAAAAPAAAGAAKPAAGGGGSAQPNAGALPGADSGAAMGMPAAMAWWNLLQDQFTQAVTTAMTPAPAAKADAAPAAAADAKAGDKPAAAQAQAQAQAPAQPAQPAQNNAAMENGNGKPRAGKPKGDKG